jgi:hypothetical protein
LPVVVGEIVAGIVIGRTGFGWLDTTNDTVAFLASVGFVMLMFAAGMNVPIRNRALVGSIRRGSIAAELVSRLADSRRFAPVPGRSRGCVRALLAPARRRSCCRSSASGPARAAGGVDRARAGDGRRRRQHLACRAAAERAVRPCSARRRRRCALVVLAIAHEARKYGVAEATAPVE